jgi:outer membrane murein-binding lipoprotein Lpp
MIKNWKNLFVKQGDAEGQKENENTTDSFSFPVNNNASAPTQASTGYQYTAPPVNDPATTEVLQVYENGLDSINMPGYDFYEFYRAINSTPHPGEQTYHMAFQMARTLDKTISPEKLLKDAEFYISKINEVHSQYVTQGQQKLNGMQERKNSDKNKLQSEIDQASARISQLRAELHQLESDINQKRTALGKIDDSFAPQERSVREKLNANDMARRVSIEKLNVIKDGIQKFILKA